MKKRILSLILAFAMAATLAPATALVGSNTAKAATASSLTSSPNSTGGTVSIPKGSTLQVTLTDSVREADTSVTVSRTVNGDTGSFSVSEAAGPITRSTAADGTTTASIAALKSADVDDGITVTYQGTIGGQHASTTDAVRQIVAKATARTANISASPSVGTIALDPKDTTNSKASYTFTVNAGKLPSNYTNDLTKDDFSVNIYSTRQGTGTTPLQVSIGTIDKSTKQAIEGAKDPSNTTGDGKNAGTDLVKTVKIDFQAAGTQAPGTYEYEIDFYVAGDKVGTTQKLTFVVGKAVSVELDADKGYVSNVNFKDDDKDGVYLGTIADVAGSTIALPQAFRDGYDFLGWKEVGGTHTLNAGDLVAYNAAILKFEAQWSEIKSFDIKTGIGATGDGVDTNGIRARDGVVSIGKRIWNTNAPFKRVGYDFIGYSTEPEANIAMWGPDAVMSNEIIDAMNSVKNDTDPTAPTLYGVWKPIVYKVHYEAGAPKNAVELPQSKPVGDTEKTFGVDIETTNYTACTFYFKGYTFSHWTVASGDALDGSRPNVVQGGKVTDATLGNTDGSKDVTVYAVWNRTASSALYSLENNFWKMVPTGTTLPEVTDQVGRIVKNWRDNTGNPNQPGSALTSGGSSYTAEYEKYIRYTVRYDDQSATTYDGFTGRNKSNHDVDYLTTETASTKFTGMTADTTVGTPAAFIGYKIYIDTTATAVDSDGNRDGVSYLTSKYGTTTDKDAAGIFTTVDNKKIAAACAATYTVNDGVYTSDSYIHLVPVFYAETNDAKVSSNNIAFEWGTSLDCIRQVITVNMTMTKPGLSAAQDLAVATYGDVTYEIVNKGGYDPTKAGVYDVIVKITPSETYKTVAASYNKTIAVTVKDKKDSDVDKVFAIEKGPVADINLENGANMYDVFAALSKLNYINAKGTDGNTYRLGIAKINSILPGNNDHGLLADSEWKYGHNYGTDLGTIDKTLVGYSKALPSNETHLFVLDANLNVGRNAGLYFQSGDALPGGTGHYDSKYIYVNVNIGSGNIPEFVPATPEDESNSERPTIAAGPVYVLYNKNDGDHYYTTDKSERDVLAALGWQIDDVTFNTPSSSDENAKPVYVIYNPNSGEHFYTMSKGERNNAVKAGWQYHGVKFYAYPKNSKLGVPIYRLWSPTATNAGSHYITASKGVYNKLGSIGWNKEDVAFRAVKAN